MRVAIGSDHAGFDLKEAVKALLAEGRTEIVDVGAFNRDPVDYPDCAEAIGTALRERRADRAILLCGSGVGASMAANRVPGVRAGLCHDTYSAHQGVEHDDMNVLVLGGRVVGVELARELVHAFLDARFTGEPRHVRRLAKVTALENPLRALQVFGQSVWLDYIRRTLVTSGELHRMIEEDGLRGVTSNPAIFEKAVAGSSDYRDVLEAPDARTMDAKALYERIALRDVRDAADALRAVYEETSTRDGYVSLEVSPVLADDTAGTLEEARRLWAAVDRPNLMIKVPATAAGIPAIEQLIGEGINVNVTLLFAQQMYERVAHAYIAGLETFAAGGGDVRTVASVASFFISRIDSAIDGIIAQRLPETSDTREQALLRSVMGKVAIANARLTYERYGEIFAGSRWSALAAAGAQTQRLLWASTGTKNPAYRDVVYVEDLIGPDTVNTIPPATLDAFRDHGRPRASLGEDLDSARDTMATLADVGIDMEQITSTLLKDGVQLFVEAFGKLLEAVKTQSGAERASARATRLTWSLPKPLAAAVTESLAEWSASASIRRLWARDATLWTGKDEGRWLGWLGITNDQLANIGRLTHVSELARNSGFSHALLLGMGGSSLCPEVFKTTFGRIEGFPELHVLDSTDPSQVRRVESSVDLSRTLCIVSSKSGSTLEPDILRAYFFERVSRLVGDEEAGRRFIAITDPGSKLQQIAESDRFRHVFLGWPDIGGRYSALSDFGLVPAAVMGLDVPTLLERADEMVCACMPSVPTEENPAVTLGIVLGVAASRFGRDKMTIVASPGIASLGAWLEQLVAESTGKEGKGIIPVDRESLAAPDLYGDDRIFIYLRLLSAPEAAQDHAVDDLERAGHPVVRIMLEDLYDLGGELFRWEMATAVAGAVLGIHPFDQPDVEASKHATRKLTAEYEARRALPSETPLVTDRGIGVFASGSSESTLAAAGTDRSLGGYLKAHLGRLHAGDYCALLAYIDMTAEHERILQAMRDEIRAATHVATCLQFGPRFLHSTGQAYKGGPNSGVFLQITSEDSADLQVPGRQFTFGVVKAAQARGDFQVLVDRDRRTLRLHLGADVLAGLEVVHAALRSALGVSRSRAGTGGR